MPAVTLIPTARNCQDEQEENHKKSAASATKPELRGPRADVLPSAADSLPTSSLPAADNDNAALTEEEASRLAMLSEEKASMVGGGSPGGGEEGGSERGEWCKEPGDAIDVSVLKSSQKCVCSFSVSFSLSRVQHLGDVSVLSQRGVCAFSVSFSVSRLQHLRCWLAEEEIR